jgi:hypothetical protein
MPSGVWRKAGNAARNPGYSRKTVESFVEVYEVGEIDFLYWRSDWNVIDWDRVVAPAALIRVAPPGAVDQRASHHRCGYAEEMSAVLPANFALANQFEVGLVH